MKKIHGNIGKKRSSEWKRKQHKIHKGKCYTPITEEIRKKLTGENSCHWKGGVSKKYILGFREKLVGRKRPKYCELCGEIGKIIFDHDHKTGKFRGWICRRCNLVLGIINDDIKLLNIMIKYLKGKSIS